MSWTSLITLLKKLITTDWQPSKQTKSNKIDSKCEIFIEAVNLLWNLCEANDTALKCLHDVNLICGIMKHANIDIYGYRVVCPVLQCIYTASEDCKEPLLNSLLQQEYFIASLRLRPGESHEDLHLQLLAQGIMLNLTASKGESVEPLLPEVITSISKVLNQDHRSLVS